MTRSVAAIVFAAVLSAPVSGQSAVTDPSPHKVGFVRGDSVSLEYLDWGGKGKAIVFLAGLGNTAHIFDDLAPRFADKYHVVGITRRGVGASDAPSSGYDLPTLVEDIRIALDSLRIKEATFVAHSFGGDEISMFATRYPNRVTKLVYLEAAYDRSAPSPPKPVPTPAATKEDLSTFDAYEKYFARARGYWSAAVDADLKATSLAPDGSVKSTMSREIVNAIMKNATQFPARYSTVRAPILAIYSRPADSPRAEYVRQNIMKLRAEHPKKLKIVEIGNSNHYVFITDADRVYQNMRKFIK